MLRPISAQMMHAGMNWSGWITMECVMRIVLCHTRSAMDAEEGMITCAPHGMIMKYCKVDLHT